ncbi:HAMP domain-containing protein [Gemmatimonadota bacterium]
MKIRTQSLLAIPPLFLFLGVTTSLVAVATGVREVRWGLEEESSSLAITVAEFVPRGSFSSDSEEAELELGYLRRSLDRLMAFEQALRITVFDAGGSPLVDIPASSGFGLGSEDQASETAALEIPPTPRWISRAEREILLPAGRLVTPVLSTPNGTAYVTAYAPILDRDLMIGTVAILVPADRLEARSAGLRTAFVGAGLGIFAAGILTTLLLSEYLRRRLRGLARAAAAVSKGHSDTRVDIGGIREVEELSNTFNTMSSILRDYVERGRRALISPDGPSETDTTITTYRERTLPSVARRIGGRFVLATTLGEERAGSFFGVAQTGEEGFAFLGQVPGPCSLPTAIGAGSAARWLVGAIEMGGPVQDLARRASELFSLSELALLSWREDSEDPPSLITGGTGDVSNAPESSIRLCTGGDRVAVLHSLDPTGIRALDAYLGFFASGGDASISDRLRSGLAGYSNGALVIVERS